MRLGQLMFCFGTIGITFFAVIGHAEESLNRHQAPTTTQGIFLAPGPSALPASEPDKSSATENEDRAPASTTKAKPQTVKTVPPLTEEERPKAEDEQKRTKLTGNWGGARQKLIDRGIDLKAFYKVDYTSNMAGGLRQSASINDNIDLILETDFEKLLGIPGLSMTLYGISNHGQNPAEYIGDTYWTSNIAAPTTTKLFEAYFKQNIDDRFSVIVGMRDLNADFYALDSSKTLINSAFGISQTLAQTSSNPFGPSIFPSTSVAATAKYESPNSFYFQAGAFNAKSGNPEVNEGTHINTTANEGYLMIYEAGAANAEAEHPFKYSVGSWTYTKPTDAIDADTHEPDNNYGFYLMADQAVSKHVSLFAKHGTASSKISQIEKATETGILIHSLWPSLVSDKLSIGVVVGTASADWQRINESKSQESVFEAGYRLEFERGFAITPDFQYISNPGLAKGVQDAQVGIMRFEVAF